MRDGWVEYKFKDVATAVKGKLPKNKNEDGIGIPYLTANFLRSSKPDYWIENIEGAVTAEDGDCLILWDGAGAGDLFSAHRGVVSSTMAVVTTQNSKIFREFLTLFISSKAEYIKETCRGTTVPHVSPDAIANMDLKIPPLSEQKRIVDLISSVDSYIEGLQQQLESAKRSRNAVLHELLTAGGEGWVETKLGLIAEFVMGQAPLGERCNKEGNGTPFVKAGEFGENRPEIVEWTTDPLKMAKHSDVLVCVVGATAGKINLGADCAIGRSVAAIQPSKKLNQFYLYYLLSLELSNLRSGSRGSAQGVITKDDLYRIPVRLPSIEEQNVTVSIVSSIDNFIDHVTSTLKHVNNLRSGLLSDLLSGEHQIPESYDKVMGAA